MYGKLFASTFTGSMMASGPEVIAVWAYVIANTCKSMVELNPALLAAVIGSTPQRMSEAIETLCAEDSNSRSSEEKGRRLVREGQFQFRVVNHEKYRSIRNEDERREYNREAKRRERARDAQSSELSMTVNDSQACQPIQKQKQKKEKQIHASKLAKPSVETVSGETLMAAGFDAKQASDFLDYKAEKKAPLTPRAWADHLREASKAGWTPASAAEKIMAKGWKGFEAKYVSDEAKPRAGPSSAFAGAL